MQSQRRWRKIPLIFANGVSRKTSVILQSAVGKTSGRCQAGAKSRLCCGDARACGLECVDTRCTRINGKVLVSLFMLFERGERAAEGRQREIFQQLVQTGLNNYSTVIKRNYALHAHHCLLLLLLLLARRGGAAFAYVPSLLAHKFLSAERAPFCLL